MGESIVLSKGKASCLTRAVKTIPAQQCDSCCLTIYCTGRLDCPMRAGPINPIGHLGEYVMSVSTKAIVDAHPRSTYGDYVQSWNVLIRKVAEAKGVSVTDGQCDCIAGALRQIVPNRSKKDNLAQSPWHMAMASDYIRTQLANTIDAMLSGQLPSLPSKQSAKVNETAALRNQLADAMKQLAELQAKQSKGAK